MFIIELVIIIKKKIGVILTKSFQVIDVEMNLQKVRVRFLKNRQIADIEKQKGVKHAEAEYK